MLRRRSAEALRAALPAACAELPLGPLTDALLAALRFRAFPEVPELLHAAGERGRLDRAVGVSAVLLGLMTVQFVHWGFVA